MQLSTTPCACCTQHHARRRRDALVRTRATAAVVVAEQSKTRTTPGSSVDNAASQRRRSASPLLYLPTPPLAAQVTWLPQGSVDDGDSQAVNTISQQQLQQQQYQKQQQQQQQAGGSVLSPGIVVHSLSDRHARQQTAASTASTGLAPQPPQQQQLRRRRRAAKGPAKWPAPVVPAVAISPATSAAAPVALTGSVSVLGARLSAAGGTAPRRKRPTPPTSTAAAASVASAAPAADADDPQEITATAALERQLIGHVQELARLRSSSSTANSTGGDVKEATAVAAGEYPAAGGDIEAAIAQGELAEALLLRMHRPLLLAAARRRGGGPDALLWAQAELLEATRRFDPSSDARLGAFAKGQMRKRGRRGQKRADAADAGSDGGSSSGAAPAGADCSSWLSLDVVAQLKATRQQLAAAGRPATVEALAAVMGLSIGRVEALLELAQQQVLQLGDAAGSTGGR